MIKIVLSDSEITLLEEAIKPASPDIIARRARIILFLNDGGTIKEAVSIFRLSERTVYDYVGQYRNEGVEGLLKIKQRPGRPLKVPSNIAEIINDALKRSPVVFPCLETAAHNWTLELMKKYLNEEHGVSLSKSHVWNLMKRHGVRHIYSKAVMTSPDPNYQEKREAVEELKKKWRTTRFRKAIE